MTAPILWNRKDSPFAFSAYLLGEYQNKLVALLKDLDLEENRSRFFDNKGYLTGLLNLFDYFPHTSLDEKDLKAFNDFIAPLKAIGAVHDDKELMPAHEKWMLIMEKADPFSMISISFTPSDFLSGVRAITETISKLIESQNKLDHIKSLGLATALKMTGYFNYSDPLSRHLATLCKVLDNFATNPCPAFDEGLKKPVTEELRSISEIIAQVSL